MTMQTIMAAILQRQLAARGQGLPIAECEAIIAALFDQGASVARDALDPRKSPNGR